MPIPSSATAFGDADLPTLFADMAIPITVNGSSVTQSGAPAVGLLDEADEVLVQDADRGEVVVLMTTLTVRTTDFPTAAIGQTVAIGTRNFTIRQRQRTGDGALTKFLLGNSQANGFGDSPLGDVAFGDS